MNRKFLIPTAILVVMLSACHSGEATSSAPKDTVGVAQTQHPDQPDGFSSYLSAIPEIKLPYQFSFEQILVNGKPIRLDTAKLKTGTDAGEYYEPDPDAAYAQLAAAYQGAVAYPLFSYKVNDELTAVAYTFHKAGSSSIIYYPFVELLVYDAKGKVKGRQLIASGTLDAEHAENTTFRIVKPTQVNTVNDVYEYADSTRSGEPLNHLEDKRSFRIQPDGKIIR